jgi:hydrogenase expression/formation protein HypC
MCLAIPGKIVSFGSDNAAEVDFGGVVRSVQMDLLPDAKKGDYVIVHAGFAIQKMSRDDAQETLRLLKDAFDDTAL